jgi:hypothetical protein
MPPSLDQARMALAAQPFSRLLGAQLNRIRPFSSTWASPPVPRHRQALSIPHRQAPRQPGYSTLPGFMTPVGSSARLIARITSVASPSSLTR